MTHGEKAVHRSQGFTLIELIVCIIILGVVSVIALPKFLGLQKDARVAVLVWREGSAHDCKQLCVH